MGMNGGLAMGSRYNNFGPIAGAVDKLGVVPNLSPAQFRAAFSP